MNAVVNSFNRNLTPTRVCNAQGGERGWQLEVEGERFAPAPGDVLDDTPQVALPEVTLRGPSTLTLARDRVFYVRPERLLLEFPTLDTTPSVELTPGHYTLEVTNPLGGTGSLADALEVVPPPTLTAVVPPPDGYVFNGPSPIVIEGMGFQPGSSPIITLRREGVDEQPLFVVTVVSPTRIETEIPPGTPEGTYDVELINQEGCGTTLAGAVTIAYARLGTLSVDPRSGWQGRNQPITLFNTPTGNQSAFSGGTPEAVILAPLKTDPAQVLSIPLRQVTYVAPDQVTAEVPTCSGFEAEPATGPECPNGILPGGPYVIRVFDPNGALGEVPALTGFTVLENEPRP